MSFFGNKFRINIFGRSHAPHIGVEIWGLPKGFVIDCQKLSDFMARRAPGKGVFSTSRKEPDLPVFTEGVEDLTVVSDKVTAVIYNKNQHSSDYGKLRAVPRPGHADYAAYLKYGTDYDLAGGGEFSGRLTAPLCIAGGIAMQILEKMGIFVGAHIYSVKDIHDTPFDSVNITKDQLLAPGQKSFAVIDDDAGEKMKSLIENTKAELDSVGGVVECAVIGMKCGVGGELFDGLESKISASLFGIPAVKGVEFGDGFSVSERFGSENNDPYTVKNGKVTPVTNRAGGILGGISTGMPITVRAAIKPTPSISKPQKSVDMNTLEEVELVIGGRHDSCIVPRAVAAVEAAVAVAILDKITENGCEIHGS